MLNDLYQTLDPIAFSIGPFSARWYGIAYALGFLLAAVVIYFVGKRWKMRFDFENICVVVICAMVGVIIGGRLGYVLVYNGPFYAAHPLEVLNFANGGMSFHGGLVGALLAGIVAAKIIKMPYLSLLDVAIIGVPIGLLREFRQWRALGRAHRSALGRGVRRLGRNDAASSEPAL